VAQVYQFVDENGVTRLFAEIQPDPTGTPFNGGTITGALAIDVASGSSTALTAEPNGANTPIAALNRAGGTAVLTVVSTSPAFSAADGTLCVDPSSVTLRLGASGTGLSVGDTGGNSNLSVAPTGQVQIQPPAGSSDDPLDVRLQDGSVGARVTVGGNFYFPGVNARVTQPGAIITAAHAAPADADLSAGECALWFDQTDGAGNTKLMVKGKSADGTVKTATILLA
jgi:hypothetical protein